MSRATSILAKVLVFAAAAVLGVVVTSVVMAVSSDRTPVSSAGAAPQYELAGVDTPSGPGPVVAFNEQPSGAPSPLPTFAPADLNAAAASLLGGTTPATTVSVKNPTGFPRIKPITQFDGGAFQGSNCTLASGSMLARLAFGIVTTGSTLRGLQDDQEGGTDLNDLDQALARGYGVTLRHGLVKPASLKNLLANGYGAVIQGIYGEIPAQLRLQRTFTGGHAIYVDGYFPGNAKRGIPEAYYVIDPIGRPSSGYEGDWWPASIVDQFALAFGGDRIAAMWAFPPGGSPPDVVGPDVLPIPPHANGPSSSHEPGSSASPEPGSSASAEPSASASAEPSAGASTGPAPSGLIQVDPGDIVLELPQPPAPPVGGGRFGGMALVPLFDFCLFTPKPAGCPTGIEVVFRVGAIPAALQLAAGPTVTVLFVDSDRANEAIVGFTVDPPATADVKFWAEGVSPGAVGHASAMSSVDILGTTVLFARLDVRAGTTYRFQAVAGDGLAAGQSEVGTFTTGSGVEQFDVALAQASSPSFGLGAGLSPYVHIPIGGLVAPIRKLSEAGSSCGSSADFGGIQYCVDTVALPPVAACTTARVSWTLTGIDADGVLVRAYPTVTAVTPDGSMSLEGVLEASGAAPTGSTDVGCLASGLTYHIVLDATGDDRGILASTDVTVP